jgi:hypothetical protein
MNILVLAFSQYSEKFNKLIPLTVYAYMYGMIYFQIVFAIIP